MEMITKDDVFQKLSKVMDPELHVDIVSLGLVYDAVVKGKKIKVTMTLTTPGCPLAPIIDKLVRQSLKSLGEYELELELVWEPAWTKEMIIEETKLKLGII